MNLEVEIIEQIEDEPLGRPIAWVREFAESLGCGDLPATLRGMWRGGHLQFVDATGQALPDWQVEQLLRGGTVDKARLMATDHGMRWAHGDD